jgi:cation diffusion facilitator family transporter
MSARKLQGAMFLSILAGLATLLIKTTAWLLTDSVGLLSDAAESLVNLTAALASWLSLRYSARPVDKDHTYGHEKIEFFASGLEGGLILVAALTIAGFAVMRLIANHQPEQLGLGMLLSVAAAGINCGVGLYLLRLGRTHQSIVLEADGKHLMTDVWTTGAVLVGLTLVWLTKLSIFDPLVAMLMAVNILWTGFGLVRRSFDGLMDHALPVAEQEAMRQAIEAKLQPGMTYHALRTRQAGSRRFVDFHLLVPGSLTVSEAHARSNVIEEALRAGLPGVEVTVHIEPIEDEGAWQDSAMLPVEAAEGQSRNPKPES